MAVFPDVPMAMEVSAAFGADVTQDPSQWVWTPLTCAHPSDPSQTISRLVGDPFTARRGILVGGRSSETTSASLHLFNHDGALTPELVTSPHWPYVDAGTPIRVRASNLEESFQDLFTRTVSGGLGDATSGQTWVTPVSSQPSVSVNGSAARFAHGSANTIVGSRNTYQMLDGDLLFDVTPGVVATGNTLLAGPQLRLSANNQNSLWQTVEFTTSGTVWLTLYRYVAGVASLVQAIQVPGLTYNSSATIRCRIQLDGATYLAKAWNASLAEPASWTIARQETITLARGRLAFFSWRTSGNTNTNPTFSIDNVSFTPFSTRLEGYIADVRPRFLPQPDGTTWSTVQVDVGGVGTRLEKNRAPALSPMRRSIQSSTETPVAYWPLEDDEGATTGASAFPGAAPMQVTGPAVFGFSAGTPTEEYLSRYGTKPMVSVAAGARLSGVVPLSVVNNEWAVSFIGDFYIPGSGLSSARICQWETPGGTHNRWALIQPSTGGYIVRAYNDLAITSTDVITYTTASYFRPTYTIEAHQVGADILVELFVDDISIATGTLSSSTQGAVSALTLNPDRVNTTASTDPFGIRFIVGHARVVDEITVHDTPYYDVPETGQRVSANTAWYREPAHRRIERLCQEERIPFLLIGTVTASGSTLLNAQQDGVFTDLVTAAAEAESGGLLFEHRFGYAYLPRSARYNQPVALTVDLATYRRSRDTDAGDVLVPELGSRVANYWTITRTRGSSATYAAPEALRKRRGTIAEERTLDVLTDADPPSHASWRVHLAVDGKGGNYPNAPVDLVANSTLIASWLGCLPGVRVQRLNQPSVAGLGPIDQVVDGVSETVGPRLWEVGLSVSPAQVWDVAVADDAAVKADTDGSTFRAATASATTLLIDVIAGPRWTTDPAQMPILVTAGNGEDMSITAISGVSNPQTATVVRGLNLGGVGRTIPADTPFSLTKPARAAL